MRHKRSEVNHAILERAKEAKDAGIQPSLWVQDLFDLSRQQTSRYLSDLCKKGLLRRHSSGRGTYYTYISNQQSLYRKSFTVGQLPLEHNAEFVAMSFPGSDLQELNPSSLSFAHDCFHTLLSNVFMHSDAKTFTCEIYSEDDGYILKVIDEGVGIFQRIMDQFHCHSRVEAVGELIKGARTLSLTPTLGLAAILWSADFATIEANNLKLDLSGRSHDWSLTQNAKLRQGTIISIEFSSQSKQRLELIQTEHLSKKGKTLLPVYLYCSAIKQRLPDRRDAKRLLKNTVGHAFLLIDFNRIEKLGLSFLEYIFIEFKQEHPQTSLMPVNLSWSIRAMLNLISANHQQIPSKPPVKTKRKKVTA